MVNVAYPPQRDRRILAVEAPGAAPERAQLVAPTVVRPRQAFALRLALADATGYPSVAFDGAVTIRGAFAAPKQAEVRFAAGEPAVAVADGFVIPEEGVYRFTAELDGRTFHSNPVICRTNARTLWWGDPHVHTVLSDCHAVRCRSLAFCFVAARHFAGLDWATAADHVSNGRCTPGKWKESVAASQAHDDPPVFVTLPGYEASFKGGAGGDNNIYMTAWAEMFVDDFEEGSVRTVCEKLAEVMPDGERFFAVPHHTTRTGKHGEIPESIYPGAERMPVVEIHSKWGTSEYRGNPNPLKKIHQGPSYVVDLLDAGLRLGFVGGTDTHATMPAGFGDDHLDGPPGMTAVRSDTLSRRAIFDGIADRNCYATSLERVYLDVTVAGQDMGRCAPWPDASRPREIRIEAAGRSHLTRVDIVRNGETIHSERLDGWHDECRFTDDETLPLLDAPYLGRFAYYYVRVTCASGARAWSSPVWLQAG
ncbi:MAG: hypothetical protein ACOC8F_04080 [Planctomycetota bacterium]